MILKSEEFNTLKDCKIETKKLKNSIFKAFRVSKDEVVLPHGFVILCGFNTELEYWFKLTDIITDFRYWLKNRNYSKYKLVTPDIQVNKKWI